MDRLTDRQIEKQEIDRHTDIQTFRMCSTAVSGGTMCMDDGGAGNV